MSQGMERQTKADWRSRSAWVRGALSTLAERASPDLRSHTAQNRAPNPDRLAAASEWLREAPRRLAGLAGGQLIDAVARIEDSYGQFPELEIDIPRRALVDELRSSLESEGGEAAVPLLMACAALDSLAPVGDLLDSMARAGQGEAIAGIVAILARRRAFTYEEIAPAVEELCRQGRLPGALAVTAAASGDGDGDPGAVALGAGLNRVLFAGGGAAGDPTGLARMVLSARNRVQRSTRPPARSNPGPQLLAPQLLAPGLLELAERVAAKLPWRQVSASSVATTSAPWRTGRLGFAEFAAQWPEICGVEIEWLPAMKVGRAGERRHAGICAKPGQSGHLVFGPYVKLGPGDYRVRVRWSAGRPTRNIPRGQPVATIEAVSRCGKTYLAQRQLRVEDYLHPEHELLFHIIAKPPPAFPIEVRVWTSGAVPLTVSSITVERIAAPSRIAGTFAPADTAKCLIPEYGRPPPVLASDSRPRPGPAGLPHRTAPGIAVFDR
jgi:hypothetical protein